MKSTIVRLILLALSLVAGGATTAVADGGGGLPPLCYPGEPRCPIK
jgi:hypothetical protein